MSIIEEAPGYLQVFSNGSVKRFAPEIATASPEYSSLTGFMSKDVTIDPSKPITARLFLPSDHHDGASVLPLVVYFHGGGFCIGSTTWLGYHHFLGDLSVTARCIVLSVDYRLAPEHRLPAAYDDCYTSLQWLISNNKNEPWLKNADLSRVFLSGDSAGGNIVHNVAVRVMEEKVLTLEIRGLLPIHPYFGSKKRTEKEVDCEGGSTEVASNDMFWRLCVPVGSDRDYSGCNFETGSVGEDWGEFPAVEVYVAGLDFLKERGLMYAEFLERRGVREVRVVEAGDEPHVFHVFDPKCEAARLLQLQMSDFIHSH